MVEELLGAGNGAPMIVGAFGGFMINVLNLAEDARKPKSSRTEKDLLYFVMFITWSAVSALLVYVYRTSGFDVKGMLAFTTGLTAPTALQTLAQKITHTDAPPPGSEA